ncbi:MAG TPA: selenocysteine-specific translation elongation factor [Candidatus Limnocylindrales bacterium]|nr:selenocysteine-specific translation elongation factor [Candidatus Limnocylindrales bacterium]
MALATVSGSYVVGTAGHIDHGKSTLVRALTGIDPDRLEEEKRRGMTIDLGFAFFDLGSGRHVGIVDVPGHQRFLKNMLAGVHGIDAVLFVVAADEGPMPQTHEHLAILDLLDVRHGVVALTKADLVDAEWLALVTAEVRRALTGHSLQDAAIVPVSGSTGAGLDELRRALDAELAGTTPRPDVGRPRLWVDRSFTMAGFGTVVTGTLTGGSIDVGAELVLLPSQRHVRVRGLQQHNRAVSRALPGSRAAVNLAAVERADVSRGELLTLPGTMVAGRRLDARLQVLPTAPRPLASRARLNLYLGTAEVPVDVVLLDEDRLERGASGYAQLYLSAPLPAVVSDRFILRQPSPTATVAGGVVIDANPRRHRRRDAAVLGDLRAREHADPRVMVAAELAKHRFGLRPDELAQRLSASRAEVDRALDALVSTGGAVRLGPAVLTAAAARDLEARIETTLREYHARNPLKEGMPREELKSRVAAGAPLFAAAVEAMVRAGRVRDAAGEVALSGHAVRLSPEQEQAVAAALAELEAGGMSPPSLDDLVRKHTLSPPVLQRLVAGGQVVRVDEHTVFARGAYDRAVQAIRDHLASQGRISVAQARDLLGSSRRYVLPLLEWLDAQKVTRRVGDDRILRP